MKNAKVLALLDAIKKDLEESERSIAELNGIADNEDYEKVFKGAKKRYRRELRNLFVEFQAYAEYAYARTNELSYKIEILKDQINRTGEYAPESTEWIEEG